jgi:hypothetical protein
MIKAKAENQGGDKVKKRGLILVCSIVLITIAFAVASSGSVLAQEVVIMRLARHNHLSVDNLNGDLEKEVTSDLLSRITDPEKRTEYLMEAKRPELLDLAWAGVENGNDLWRDGHKIEAQWCWIRTALSYLDTDASFASIMNLATTLVETENFRGATYAYSAVLALPNPKFRASFSRNIEDFRHSACLALSELNLERGNYNASLKYMALAISTYRTDTSCGVYFFSHLHSLEERLTAIEEAKRTQAQVEWTD